VLLAFGFTGGRVVRQDGTHDRKSWASASVA
jgi:hypothetical protein